LVNKPSENKAWIGKDNIIYVEIVKAESKEDIIKLLDEVIKPTKEVSGPPRVLINIATTSVIKSSGFRKR